MGRFGVAGVAALCGAFAAAPSLAVATGSPNSLILVYLSQLPLFIGGLWLGAGAAVMAGLTASLILLAASNIMAALMFAALNVVPVVLLVRQALLARTGAAAGTVQWYPPGLLAVWLTGLGLTAIAVALLVLGGPDGMETTVSDTLAPALDRLFVENAPGRDELAGLLAMIMPGLVAASWMAMTLINGTLAQGLLARFGASWRPSPALGTLSLPMWFPVLPVLAASATALPSYHCRKDDNPRRARRASMQRPGSSRS